MLKDLVMHALSMPYESRLLVFDTEGFRDVFDYPALLHEHGYEIYYYEDVEAFRLVYESELRYNKTAKCAVVVQSRIYVPYDIRKALFPVELSLAALFNGLDENTLRRFDKDLELVSIATKNQRPLRMAQMRSGLDYAASADETLIFIREQALSKNAVMEYADDLLPRLKEDSASARTYLDWISIGKQVARLRFYGLSAGLDFDLDLGFVDSAFGEYIISGYSSLTGEVGSGFPPILTKTMQTICKTSSEKIALIVMDGMSLVDFEVISRHMSDIRFAYNCSFSLVPSTTSISRQSLLSGKYPQQLEKPFSLSHEERLFYEAAMAQGYAKNQVQYLRGYQPEISIYAKFISVIINDIDDIVHGQIQGRRGMFQDVAILAEQEKLQRLVRSLADKGFTVYLTSDHGNTLCFGVGSLRGGVEVESKAKRMVAFKDFAEESEFLTQNTIQYPGYFLDRSYRYYLCKPGVSFDSKGSSVMTHGGASIDEVIVPFIKILEA